jgi:hypothetical protein
VNLGGFQENRETGPPPVSPVDGFESPPRPHALPERDTMPQAKTPKARNTVTLRDAEQRRPTGSIVHTELVSRNPELSRAFLEGVFGWSFEEMETPAGSYHVATTPRRARGRPAHRPARRAEVLHELRPRRRPHGSRGAHRGARRRNRPASHPRARPRLVPLVRGPRRPSPGHLARRTRELRHANPADGEALVAHAALLSALTGSVKRPAPIAASRWWFRCSNAMSPTRPNTAGGSMTRAGWPTSMPSCPPKTVLWCSTTSPQSRAPARLG